MREGTLGHSIYGPVGKGEADIVLLTNIKL